MASCPVHHNSQLISLATGHSNESPTQASPLFSTWSQSGNPTVRIVRPSAHDWVNPDGSSKLPPDASCKARHDAALPQGRAPHVTHTWHRLPYLTVLRLGTHSQRRNNQRRNCRVAAWGQHLRRPNRSHSSQKMQQQPSYKPNGATRKHDATARRSSACPRPYTVVIVIVVIIVNF